MKPDEALYHLENHGGMGVPRLYAEMSRGTLQRLVDECARMSGTEKSEAALTAWAQQRMKQTNWLGIAEKKLGIASSKPDGEAEAAPCLVEPLPEEPETLAYRAILKPERLSTPRRRQSAFLSHFARCRTLLEAAARTGVDRRTVHRWRQNDPLFDRKCRDIIEARRRQAVENVVLAADHVEVRPVFYRGKKIAEYTRRDRALDLYLLKQADAQALRAEQQAEKRREAEAGFEARVAAEVEKRIAAAVDKAVEKAVEKQAAPRHSEMSPSAGLQAAPQDDEFTNVFNDFEPATCDMALAR
jgi:hypothetical protein